MQIKLVSREQAEEMCINFGERALYGLSLSYNIWGKTYDVLRIDDIRPSWSNGVTKIEYSITDNRRWYIPAWLVEEIYEDEE